MTLPAEPVHRSKLEAVVQSLESHIAGGFAGRFAEELFCKADIGELENYETGDLAALAASAFESFRVRKGHQPKVVFSDCTVKGTGFLVIDIVNDDMPFLLDSVISELRDRGLTPELVAHPIFEVRRDPEGQLSSIDVARAGTRSALHESFIHLQIRKTRPLLPPKYLKDGILRVLADVRTAVSDFEAMTDRLHCAVSEFERKPPPVPAGEVAEALAFLRWLGDGNFTFLGARDYDYSGGRDTGQLVPKAESGLGLLRNTAMRPLLRGEGQPSLTPQIRSYFLNSPPVIVAKGNDRSTVRRRVHMDVVGVKLYGEGGRITGQLRLAGLFTASAYTLSTLNIPLLRLRTGQVLCSSGYPHDSHSERALLNVIESFPRDELFQISAGQLAKISGEILKTDLTSRPRVFIRRDEFERFVSAFVYVPRERYNTDVRVAVLKMLEAAFCGRFESFTPFFSDGAMVRIHYVIWRNVEALKDAEEADLEREVEKIVRTWSDELHDRLLKHYGAAAYRLADKYLNAFPAGYQETNRPSRALEDIRGLEKLGPDLKTEIDIHRDDPLDRQSVRATLLQVDEPLTLSKRVPIFENLGFDVISERTFELTPKISGKQRRVYLHDSSLHLPDNGGNDLLGRGENLEKGFLAIWSGEAQNDGFNGLILNAGLHWRQAALLRAYGAYYRQTGAPYGNVYVSQVLNKHANTAGELFALFDRMFNPASGSDPEGRDAGRARISARIAAALDKIPVLDEDHILRNLLAMINATLRTNFYHRSSGGKLPETIAFKLRSSEIDWLPAPKPFAEIFVYSPRFEGIHLRGGPIARGGIRWSDRPQDFRTEILSLAKAQQVKNVVIVPQGAKGGFVPRLRKQASREAAQAEGVTCYKSFVSSLLSLTDNRVKGEIVSPERTVRRDGDDPYLVVAADKGTASFSDIANEIALSRNFWLGDAFASGGSAGYDHKKMGITAKGAWEAVKRHFREMDIDIQTAPFTVAGIGDMSGDVFGNGMLLSKAIKLVAAFDHRDIFIDPDPDPAVSFAERQRLFDLPRSSWQNYDRSKISKGGGVYSRDEKYITLSAEAQKLFGVGPAITPAEIMEAIVRAPVDLLWFGGIGTYVRASGETDAQVNDKANDAIRAPAKDVRAKVIGEGANLGVTQRGRIEFALRGGRINTDAIDNSAGVNTSDAEVNIKIALGAAAASGKLDTPARNELLAAMTDEVAASVLRNNYLQTLAISLAEMDGLADLGFQQRLMQTLEKQDHLDRALENLPSDAAILERQAAAKPLTRPELAVLLAFAKIDLNHSLIGSSVPDDPHLGRALRAYFPPLMQERFAGEIAQHPLRREIIATRLANDIINSGGPTFIVRLIEETGNTPEDIAYAFAAVTAVYGLGTIYAGIDSLDGKIGGRQQLLLYRKVQELLRKQTAWFLRHGLSEESLEPEIERYRDGVERLAVNLAAALPKDAQARTQKEQERLQAEGVPPTLAERLAALGPLLQALDAVRVADTVGVPIADAAQAIFAIRNAFHLDELAAASEALAAGDYFDRLAVNSCLAAAASAQRALAKSVLKHQAAKGDFEAWRKHKEASAGRVAAAVAGMLEGRGLTLAKLTVGVAQLQDLAVA
ncbi:MAG: NAD-glutamate dehydrogenase [Rhodomicrobium sp.]